MRLAWYEHERRAAQNARYKRWIDQVVRGIGDNELVIAFEPDSLGLIECLRPACGGRGCARSATA